MATFSRVAVSCLFLHGIAGIDQRSLHQIYQPKLWGMYVHPQTWINAEHRHRQIHTDI
jgi:hypothetical protein